MQSAPPDIAFQSKGPDVSKDKAPPSAWRTPRAQSLAVIVCLLALVSWLTVPRLPTGICFDDAGDLQLSSATLGIAHPPGYPGYVTIGFLLTRIPGVDPAYVVSVICFVTGLSVLAACVLLQNHLGASIWLSAAVTLALAAHPRFWTNLRAPEVYMPTLALLAWSACFLLRFSITGLRRYLVLAVFLFGMALGNRPPVLFAVPFFLIAWHFAQRRLAADKRGGWKDLAWMVPLAVAPTVYSLAYIYVRDRPDVCYNYIENHNEELHVLPSGADGVRAKLRTPSGMSAANNSVNTWARTGANSSAKCAGCGRRLHMDAPLPTLLFFFCSPLESSRRRSPGLYRWTCTCWPFWR